MFSIIVAATPEGGIGKDGQLPWKYAEDAHYFQTTTTLSESSCPNVVIMGRNTWDSLPVRPLPNRWNVVISRHSNFIYPLGVLVYRSLAEALDSLKFVRNTGQWFVIGGAQLLEEALRHPQCKTIHLSVISRKDGTAISCDTFLPTFDWKPLFQLDKTIAFSPSKMYHGECQLWSRTAFARPEPAVEESSVSVSSSSTSTSSVRSSSLTHHEEYQYLSIVRDILTHGTLRHDRTGVGTLSKFGYTMRFDLSRNQFPLLTTKKVFFRAVVEELLWFLQGNTNARLLRDKGIKIWDGNASRAYLDSIGLTHREEDDLGPIYGFQWRHFGARYNTMHDDYTGQGIDQIQDLIHRIRSNPYDRRLILTAWNPMDLKAMALPPCHCFCQFYVSDGALSCQMYQRSCDMGLGVPFNIASYALLVRIMAQLCHLNPGEFIHVLGDAHVYTTHIAALQQQLEREPRPFPTLTIDPNIRLDTLSADQFHIHQYQPWEKIQMAMAV